MLVDMKDIFYCTLSHVLFLPITLNYFCMTFIHLKVRTCEMFCTNYSNILSAILSFCHCVSRETTIVLVLFVENLVYWCISWKAKAREVYFYNHKEVLSLCSWEVGRVGGTASLCQLPAPVSFRPVCIIIRTKILFRVARKTPDSLRSCKR